jgi:hypothetical protein
MLCDAVLRACHVGVSTSPRSTIGCPEPRSPCGASISTALGRVHCFGLGAGVCWEMRKGDMVNASQSAPWRLRGLRHRQLVPALMLSCHAWSFVGVAIA